MAKKSNGVFRYKNTESESSPEQKEASFEPAISEESAEKQGAEEYKPPNIERERFSDPDLDYDSKGKEASKKTSIFNRGGE